MVEIENNCVGCPQGCINCGLQHDEVHYCDICGDVIVEESAQSYDFDCCWECEWEHNELTIEDNYDEDYAWNLLKRKYKNGR